MSHGGTNQVGLSTSTRTLSGPRLLGVARAVSVVSAAALLGCGALKPALTCPEQGGAPWLQMDSAHFALRTDLSEDGARDTLKELEQSYEAFTEVAFRSDNPPADKIDVVLMDRSADYEAVAPEKTNGFFTEIGLDARPTIVIKGVFSRDVRAAVQHEVAHRFVRYFMPRAPIWLNEGLAEFYETMRFENNEIILGEVSPGWHFYHPAIGGAARQWGTNVEAIPSATELLDASNETFYDAERKHYFYAGAWFLVSTLINGSEDYHRRFWTFAHKLSDGTVADVAWRESFAGVSSATLNDELRSSILTGKTVIRRARFIPDEPRFDAPEPMADADIHALWAKLLLIQGPNGAAKAIAETDEALRLAPDMAEAHHLRGLIALAQDRDIDAEAEFRSAAKVEPNEARHLHGLVKAIMAQEAPKLPDKRDWSRLDDPLSKLAKLATRPSVMAFVGACYGETGKLDEGIVFAKRAVEAEAGCWSCLHVLASLAFAKGWMREAADLERRVVSLVPHSSPAAKEVVKKAREYALAAKAEEEGAKTGAASAELGAGTNTSVVPFREGMERPRMVSGRDPVYTREALDACAQGLIIARCTITTEGDITNCRIIKSLPLMDRPVVDALQSRKYTPVLDSGKAVAVDYIFNIKLVLPASCGAKVPPSK